MNIIYRIIKNNAYRIFWKIIKLSISSQFIFSSLTLYSRLQTCSINALNHTILLNTIFLSTPFYQSKVAPVERLILDHDHHHFHHPHRSHHTDHISSFSLSSQLDVTNTIGHAEKAKRRVWWYEKGAVTSALSTHSFGYTFTWKHDMTPVQRKITLFHLKIMNKINLSLRFISSPSQISHHPFP